MQILNAFSSTRWILMASLAMLSPLAQAASDGQIRINLPGGMSLRHSLEGQLLTPGSRFPLKAQGIGNDGDQITLSGQVVRLNDKEIMVNGGCSIRSKRLSYPAFNTNTNPRIPTSRTETQPRPFFRRFSAPRQVIPVCGSGLIDIQLTSIESD